MGHTAIINAAVAVGIALVCLLVGRGWGRSNVKSQVEDALEGARKAADAREFTIREQLDQKMAEVARLTPIAEEFNRLREELKRDNPALAARFSETPAASASAEAPGVPDTLVEPEEAHQPVESADAAIQKLLQSLESNLQQPESSPAVPVAEPGKPEPIVPKAPEPLPAPAVSSAPAAERVPTPPPQSISSPRPTPPPPPAAVPRPITAPQPMPMPAAPRPAAPLPTASQPAASQRPAAAAAPSQAAPKPPAAPRATPVSAPAPAKPSAAKPSIDEWQEFARSLDALTRRQK